MKRIIAAIFLVSLCACSVLRSGRPAAEPDALESVQEKYEHAEAKLINRKDTGYRGIWYSIGSSHGEYVYKYSGGLGTYPANHYPFSVYTPEENKTFFCYGGTDTAGTTLYHEVAYFDHTTGKVSRPTIVLDKETNDAHDNPVIQVDKDGYIWLFSTSHGTGRPSFIHRSVAPYDIGEFKRINAVKMEDGKEVPMDNFSYLQIYYTKRKGFLGLFTHYEQQELEYGPKTCRVAGYMTSKDGVHWSEWKDLANIEEGHYQTSGKRGNRIGTSFNYHPNKEKGAGLDYRTNLYYIYTDNFGKTWKNADGTPLDLPLKTISNDALIHDYTSENLNVYINDLNFDEKGNPVILYVTSKGFEPGPENGPHRWNTARWTGVKWEIMPVTVSDNNYDMGSLYTEESGTWRVIGPTGTGPQAYNTGGEMEMWISKDKGQKWTKVRQLTAGSEYNHSYARRPMNANPGFYAFWADGHGRRPSSSRLYFSDREGNTFLLPENMTDSTMKPIAVPVP